ncbi:hypothetical protein RISK_005783 [Rhodopirellula islandica]|uniref:Uncharacterized protein n=1 Tax=Rhodopirellula islandica TaxID=595434 RepID=A0A0J1B7L2_RHOIS|nr:hypothetical protein RISK_005783 [Rhodopirellula islandica]
MFGNGMRPVVPSGLDDSVAVRFPSADADGYSLSPLRG